MHFQKTLKGHLIQSACSCVCMCPRRVCVCALSLCICVIYYISSRVAFLTGWPLAALKKPLQDSTLFQLSVSLPDQKKKPKHGAVVAARRTTNGWGGISGQNNILCLSYFWPWEPGTNGGASTNQWIGCTWIKRGTCGGVLFSKTSKQPHIFLQSIS